MTSCAGTKWKWRYGSNPLAISALQRDGWSALYFGEDLMPTAGGWVGLGAGLNGHGKFRPPQEYERRSDRPIASRYTDYAVQAFNYNQGIKFIAHVGV